MSRGNWIGPLLFVLVVADSGDAQAIAETIFLSAVSAITLP